MTLEDFFTSIDYTLLREQKYHLLIMRSSFKDGRIDENEKDVLDGIIHILDKIQDIAADELHFSEEKVFGFKR